MVRFRVRVPDGFPEEEVRKHLARQGYTRVARAAGRASVDSADTAAGPETRTAPVAEATPGNEEGDEAGAEPVELEVTQDRLRIGEDGRARLVEALEAALAAGRGRAEAAVGDGPDHRAAVLRRPRMSALPHRVPRPGPQSLLVQLPIGACDTCRGFGREMGIDYDLVVPDERLTLREGAIKPFRTKTYLPYQRYLLEQVARVRVPDDVPWRDLRPEEREWVIEGDGRRRDGHWFGVRGYFAWLERKSYRMHIRVLLSRYRGYLPVRGVRRRPAQAGSPRLAARGGRPKTGLRAVPRRGERGGRAGRNGRALRPDAPRPRPRPRHPPGSAPSPSTGASHSWRTSAPPPPPTRRRPSCWRSFARGFAISSRSASDTSPSTASRAP